MGAKTGASVVIYIRKLSMHDRHVWGKCPVCGVSDGERCIPACADNLTDGPEAAHIARLINAPQLAAIGDDK